MKEIDLRYFLIVFLMIMSGICSCVFIENISADEKIIMEGTVYIGAADYFKAVKTSGSAGQKVLLERFMEQKLEVKSDTDESSLKYEKFNAVPSEKKEDSKLATAMPSMEGVIMEPLELKGEEQVYKLITPEGQNYKLVGFSVGEGKELLNGDIVRVNGVLSKTPFGDAVIKRGEIEILSRSPGEENLLVEGEKKVVVLLVNFMDNQSQPWSISHIEDSFFNVADSMAEFYKEASFEKVTLSGKAYGWYTLDMDMPPPSLEGCDSHTIRQKAIDAADSEVNFNGVDVVFFVYPNIECGGTSGIGNWGAFSTNEGIIFVGAPTLFEWADNRYHMSHELGHIFGLRHSSSSECQNLYQYSDGCSYKEYGNLYDTMGATYSFFPGHFNAKFKKQLGWISATNDLLVSNDGIYKMSPLEKESSDIQSLSISGQDYTVEYRKPFGFDGLLLPYSGIHILNDSGKIIYKHKNTSNPYIVAMGEKFWNPVKGLVITPVQEDGQNIWVDVKFDQYQNLKTSNSSNIPPELSLVGGSVSFDYTTINDGSADMDQVYQDGFFIKSPGRDEILIEKKKKPALTSQQMTQDQFGWTSDGSQCGDIAFSVYSDFDKKVPEKNENDNSVVQMTHITCPDIDLELKSFNGPDTIPACQSASYDYSVINNGSQATSSINGSSFKNVIKRGDGAVLVSETVLNLDGHQTMNGNFNFNMGICQALELHLETDGQYQIAEYDETNNKMFKKVWSEFSPSCVTQPIMARSAVENNGVIEGNNLVFIDRRSDLNQAYLYNFVTKSEQQLSSGEHAVVYVAIKNNKVAWAESINPDDGILDFVYIYDIDTGSTTELVLGDYPASPFIVEAFAFNGQWIVLENTNSQLWSYDLFSQQMQQISSFDAQGGKSISISPEHLVWAQPENLADDFKKVHLYEFSTGVITTIYDISGSNEITSNPVVWGNKITFFSKGASVNTLNIYDISNGSMVSISLDLMGSLTVLALQENWLFYRSNNGVLYVIDIETLEVKVIPSDLHSSLTVHNGKAVFTKNGDIYMLDVNKFFNPGLSSVPACQPSEE